MLEQACAQLAGFSGGRARYWHRLSHPRALAELLTVPAELETAVSAALGSYLEALVVGDQAETEAAIAKLGPANGRAVLLPLQHLHAAAPLTPPSGDDGVVGIAAQLVSAEDWLRPMLLRAHDAQFRRRSLAQVDAECRAVELTSAAKAEGRLLPAGERETIGAPGGGGAIERRVQRGLLPRPKWRAGRRRRLWRRAQQDAQTHHRTRGRTLRRQAWCRPAQKIVRLDAGAERVSATTAGA
jgi:hypothetical protein